MEVVGGLQNIGAQISGSTPDCESHGLAQLVHSDAVNDPCFDMLLLLLVGHRIRLGERFEFENEIRVVQQVVEARHHARQTVLEGWPAS